MQHLKILFAKRWEDWFPSYFHIGPITLIYNADIWGILSWYIKMKNLIFLKIKRSLLLERVHFHYYEILLFHPWHWVIFKHHRRPGHLSNSFYDNILSIKICYHDGSTSTNLLSITLKNTSPLFYRTFYQCRKGSNALINLAVTYKSFRQTTYSNLQQPLAQRHQKALLLILYPLPVWVALHSLATRGQCCIMSFHHFSSIWT